MRNKSKSRPDHSKVDWRNEVRSGENYRKYNFFSARFEDSEFKNCDFSAVSAKRACFIRANLTGSNFTGANLEGANFGGADLTDVNFKGAILKQANFENAITDGANFLNASIKMAKKLTLSAQQKQEIEETMQAQKEKTSVFVASEVKKKQRRKIPNKHIKSLVGSPGYQNCSAFSFVLHLNLNQIPLRFPAPYTGVKQAKLIWSQLWRKKPFHPKRK
ncbi:pentapeptide repeat-containing protein [Dickeya ananatis]|uniref:pentapeptide repeat-containing protein n=1 Tax=Dickeya ananatis TaxID=3061286 RepID=UPI00389098DE